MKKPVGHVGGGDHAGGAWEESKHPRKPSGTEQGGEFTGKLTTQNIETHDVGASVGFNSVSLKDVKDLTNTELKARLRAAIHESQYLAHQASALPRHDDRGLDMPQHRNLLAQSAHAYGRAQKLSNILAKRVGGESIPVYHPFARHL